MGMVDYYQIYFANGGDRGKGNVPELDVCKELGVTMLWGVGGGKIQSFRVIPKTIDKLEDEKNKIRSEYQDEIEDLKKKLRECQNSK